MKKYLMLSVLAISAVLFIASSFTLPENPVSKDFPVQKFSELQIALKSQVFIEQAENYSLSIETDEETMEMIKVENNSGELSISCKKDKNSNSPVVIHITTPVLKKISLAGSSEVNVENTFNTEEMNLNIAGSGKINFGDLKSDDISASIAGSGNIVLAGGKEGSQQHFSIAGSGNIDASACEAPKVKVEIAGSGNCQVFAGSELNVSIAGSGNVMYKGSPEIKKEINGSGKLKALDKK
ncbi:MAG: DUF2807 domain-containing protein [Bacteroidales bacterium]|nr:DUF2807 domain-containing protein [Bacteroidales bacterium]MCB8998584.1 DUF2807 domain-containing protein [Bacteroidales bacterium]MCB9012548.1 DUF2807 domain-containing protein [Bacteroidales bacterium]